MKSTACKPRLTVAALIIEATDYFAQSENRRPSHCDVRCVCNEILYSYERNGYTVPHNYNQDNAHREILCALHETEQE